MESLLQNFGQIMASSPLLAVFFALLGGLVSAFSPCVLTSLPLIIGYIAGPSDNRPPRALSIAVVFSLGLALTLTFLGTLAALMGRMLNGLSNIWSAFLGVFLILMGLWLTGLISFDHANPAFRFPTIKKNLWGAFSLGILSGIASSPCATPVLAAILGFVAQRGNIWYGGALLLIYSLAHCTLIILAGISTGFLQNLANNSRMMIWGKVLRFTLGGVVILSGFYFIYASSCLW
ncbi:MAG: cytochrome c biogenesis protein CcdA [Firmicutes bacterium]|nr:cytochrome c biogenesis protein CcdA [Bacillota bacterium]